MLAPVARPLETHVHMLLAMTAVAGLWLDFFVCDECARYGLLRHRPQGTGARTQLLFGCVPLLLAPGRSSDRAAGARRRTRRRSSPAYRPGPALARGVCQGRCQLPAGRGSDAAHAYGGNVARHSLTFATRARGRPGTPYDEARRGHDVPWGPSISRASGRALDAGSCTPGPRTTDIRDLRLARPNPCAGPSPCARRGHELAQPMASGGGGGS
jgi:hypothetical protein